MCGGPALGLLSPAELELLVAGLPHLDFTALEKAAKASSDLSLSTKRCFLIRAPPTLS